MEINTFSEYLKEPYSLTMAQMQQFHEEMVEEIGNELNLSRERVRQIKEKNLRILRSEILLLDNFEDLFIK